MQQQQQQQIQQQQQQPQQQQIQQSQQQQQSVQQVGERQAQYQQQIIQNQQSQNQNHINRQQQNEKIIESLKSRLESLFIKDSLLNDKFLLTSTTSDYQLPVSRILEESSISDIFQSNNQKNEYYKYVLLEQALLRLENIVEINYHAHLSQNFRVISIRLKYQKSRTQIEVRFDPPQKEEAKRLIDQEIKKFESSGKNGKVVVQDRNYKDKLYIFTETNQDAIDLFMIIFKLKFENGKSLIAQIQDSDFIAKANWQHFSQHIETRNLYARNQINDSVQKQVNIFLAQQNKSQQQSYNSQQPRQQNNQRGNNQYNNANGLNYNNNGPNRQGQYQYNNNNNNNNRQNSGQYNSYRQNNQNRQNETLSQKPFNPDENSFPNLEASTQQNILTQNQYFEQQQQQAQTGQQFALQQQQQQQQQVQKQPQQQQQRQNQ